MMRTLTMGALLLTMTGSSLGCQFIARSPERYRGDTRALLDSGKAAVKTCYDKEHKSDNAAQGTVTHNYTVEKEPGILAKVEISAANTSAPKGLQACVVSSLPIMIRGNVR